MSRGRVLVMDDDRNILRAASRMLKLLGCEVWTRWPTGRPRSPAIATPWWLGARFDVVILDLSVGVTHVGGNEALADLMALDGSVCAIVSSGELDATALSQHLANGFKGGLRKPYDRASLEEQLAKLLPRA
ncbi:MAG: response regulator [Myxococcaceae bacterium]|nr:response regulator [Myxococcaceae bacterium]